MVTWLAPIPIVGVAPLSFVPLSTSPMLAGVLPVAGFTLLGTFPEPNVSLFFTTTFTVLSAEEGPPPFSAILYLSVYSPAGVLGATFTLPVVVSIVTPGLEVWVWVISTKLVVIVVLLPKASLLSTLASSVPFFT